MQVINRLQIKGMVCTRCIAILFEELSLIDLEITSIKLGEVFFKGQLPQNVDENRIQSVLQKYGFELLSDKKLLLVARMKDLIKAGIDLQSETRDNIKFSEYLSAALHKDYNYLSAVFSDCEGITLEKYIITQRILKVKDELINTDKSLTEISDELGYSSVSHLSRQLKAYTGFDTYHFKNLRKNNIISA
ncbi:AraC family transcriptional regulator [Flavobacterium sp. J49]|uniref:helix-turn-helix domain-containing protein n=1 Tax=Flavobacterium sp. J49 TaxID=2718534 RepID=UPI0015932FBB|nr:helix-turn-helix domain-containing protein [Flavobacterium sp. J49]MBF6640293.1 AraC family transcriptional regulator [Flavobacterium sp. J49]NIC01538.1 AraC family transcriptional regulator [Flavobacterium sp. J49]